MTNKELSTIYAILDNAREFIYDRPLGSNPRLVITHIGMEKVKRELKELVNEDNVDELKNLVQIVVDENKADELKLYYVSNKDYCLKIIKEDKIVKCFRRGIERGKKNGKRRNA